MLAIVFCFSQHVQAEETAQLPYATLHKVVSRAEQVKHPKLRSTVTVKSKSEARKPIKMVIQAKSGPINVSITDEGEIRAFPLSPELLKENPPVVSNQPKGSSALQVGLEAVVPDMLTYSYRDLASVVEAANVEIKKQAGMLSLMVPRAKALAFQFRGAGRQTVTIKSKAGQVLTADESGVARLEIDKSLVSQDPQVVVSEKPTKIVVN